MRRLLIFGLVAILATGVTAAVWAAGGDAAAGKAVYEKKCATCHGKEGEGKPALAKALKVEMRHLSSKEVQAKTDAQLRQESVEGIGKMKPVKGLTDEDTANLLAFLRTLKEK